MASADSDVIRWRRLQISELHPLKVLRLWHKCLTPLQKAPLWGLSRGEVLQLLPYLDCLKSVKQSSMTSEITSCWLFLQVNSKPPLSSSDSVSSPCNKSPLVRFQCVLERDSCFRSQSDNITEIVPTEISSTTSACQRQEQEVLVDETLTVIVAPKAEEIYWTDLDTFG